MSLIQCKFLSNVLKMPANVFLALPDFDFLNQNPKPFPVLYLLHGFSGDSMDWLRFTSIERYAFQRNIAVVMPSGYNSAYTDMKYGQNYFTYLSQELPSYMEKVFPVSNKPQNRFVAGCSMGGYGAMKLALSCPGKFAAAASLSGSLHVEDRILGLSANSGNQCAGIYGDPPVIQKETQDLFYMLRRLAENNQPIPRLFLCCAEDDKPYLQKATEDFRSLAEELSLTPHFQSGYGGHGYDYWDPILPQLLDWLLKK